MSDKSLFFQLAETYERHRLARRAAGEEPTSRPLARFLRWMVPNGGTILVVLVLLLTQQVWARPAQQQLNAPGPSATTVNYQGRLADPLGNPLDGSYGMTFSLWDAPAGGALVWGPENHPAVPVSGGLFSVGLGSLTSGGIPTTVWNGDRYLEMIVGGETLSPRELIRSVPIAGMALTVPDGAITTDNLAAGAIPVFSASTTEYLWELPACNDARYSIPGLTLEITVARTSNLLVDFTGLGRNDAAGGRIYTTIHLDGQVVKTAADEPLVGGCRNSPTDSGWWPYCTLANTTVQSLAPGSHTVEIRATCDQDGTAVIQGGWLRAIVLP